MSKYQTNMDITALTCIQSVVAIKKLSSEDYISNLEILVELEAAKDQLEYLLEELKEKQSEKVLA